MTRQVDVIVMVLSLQEKSSCKTTTFTVLLLFRQLKRKRSGKEIGSPTTHCDKCHSETVERFCTSCRQVLCITCCEKFHNNTSEHYVMYIGGNTSTHESDECRDKIEKPGKPRASAEITSFSVVIYWSKPTTTCKNVKYEVRGKLRNEDSWNNPYNTHYARRCARIINLKQNTEYEFQVRVSSDDDNDCPWSQKSDAIKTKQSAAFLLFSNTKYCIVRNPNETPQLGILQFVMGDRDATANIRKLSFGEEDTSYTEEKTILFLGETGAGKTTLVDRLINHIMVVDWNDEFRLSIVDLEKEEQNRALHQSQTRWITIYSIDPLKGGRLKYRLNVIDTPGFGDIERSEHDIDKQIKTLFNETNNICLHAICIVVKKSTNRLTLYQNNMFKSILSLFGNDIKQNIVVMITHGDSPNRSVLNVLENAGVPIKSCFALNNEPFEVMTNSAKIAWGLSGDSLNSFFDHINKLDPCSLHLSRQILDRLARAEYEIKSLRKHLSDGMQRRHQLQQEIQTLKRCKEEIEAMEKISTDKAKQDTSYSHSETADDTKRQEEYFRKKRVKRTICKKKPQELPEPEEALNCTNCKLTCERDAGIAKYLPIWFSSSISLFGSCKICSCKSAKHSVDTFEYIMEETDVFETLSDLLTELNEMDNAKARDYQFKQKQQHSYLHKQKKILTDYIDIINAELRNMEHKTEILMTNLHACFEFLVNHQLKNKHHSLREYLESCFDDKDKDKFLKELEPFLQNANSGTSSVRGEQSIENTVSTIAQAAQFRLV